MTGAERGGPRDGAAPPRTGGAFLPRAGPRHPFVPFRARPDRFAPWLHPGGFYPSLPAWSPPSIRSPPQGPWKPPAWGKAPPRRSRGSHATAADAGNDNLATKTDLAELKAELKADMAALTWRMVGLGAVIVAAVKLIPNP